MKLWNHRFWYPMLLQEVKAPFNDSDWIFELKFDGQRAILFVSPTKVVLYNRHGKDITYLYPELQAIRKLVNKNTIFDGELVSFFNGKPSFSCLQKRAHLKNKSKIFQQSQLNPVVYMAFDLLYENKSYLDMPLILRKEKLAKYPDSDEFVKVHFIEKKGVSFFKKVKNFQLEGIVAKKKDSIYVPNSRSYDWLKIKNWQEEVFLIGGYIEMESGSVSLLLGEKKNSFLHYVGKVVLPKQDPFFSKLKKVLLLKSSPFDVSLEAACYISPVYSCLVEYLERTTNNHLRQPTFRKMC